jgi:hypothetical protein
MRVLRAAIASLSGKLPGRQYAAAKLKAAQELLADGKVSKSDLKQLKTIEADLKNHGLPHAAKVIQQKVAEAQKAEVEKQRETIQAIKDKDLSVNVTVPISTTTQVSINGIIRKVTTRQSFGASALSGGLGVSGPAGINGG